MPIISIQFWATFIDGWHYLINGIIKSKPPFWNWQFYHSTPLWLFVIYFFGGYDRALSGRVQLIFSFFLLLLLLLLRFYFVWLDFFFFWRSRPVPLQLHVLCSFHWRSDRARRQMTEQLFFFMRKKISMSLYAMAHRKCCIKLNCVYESVIQDISTRLRVHCTFLQYSWIPIDCD